MDGNDPLQDFRWSEQPQAAAVIAQLVQTGVAESTLGRELSERLEQHSGTRLVDWLTSIVVPPHADIRQRLHVAGFIGETGVDSSGAGALVLRHPGGLFPPVICRPDQERLQLVIAVDRVADFLARHGLTQDALSDSSHLLQVSANACVQMWVSDVPSQRDPTLSAHSAMRPGDAGVDSALCARYLVAFRRRPRDFTTHDQAFASLQELLTQAIAACGRDPAGLLFFAAEREFWQARNHAAQVQKARQDDLGMGWANHDHHTYRSSRRCFKRMIALFEQLGFTCRERFYPGGAAGWGAQVMEHPATGLVIFADVDMNSRELREDFAHQPFSDHSGNRALGTVGLWCALHGESLFSAGMHHLACKVDFNRVRPLLAQERIVAMKAFSDYPYLRQCFTQGEFWPVREDRLERLAMDGQISPEQTVHFRQGGALGSHLELIERNAGFKGFNQHGVDEIINNTDPRRSVAGAGEHHLA
jgi:hypothetical protein